MFKAVKNKSRLGLGLLNAPADVNSAKWILFYGPKYADAAIYDLNDYKSLLDDKHFKRDLNTVIYMHGYIENPDVESVHTIVDAYLQRTDTNFIVLDWSSLADGNYMFDAVPNMKQLGPVMAKYILEMFKLGLNLQQLHLVGHSMGSQLAGIIGREVYKRSDKTLRIKRISGLDPAFPLFYTAGLTSHISSKDAEFVDIIHTDACLYGAPTSTGTADFWPNSGKTLQPGCPKRNYQPLTDNDLQSHWRSWLYWAESVANGAAQFDAVKAKSWSDFKNGKTSSIPGVKVVMGHDCPTNISGNFYLQTNGCSPFARGLAGATFIDPKQLPGNQTT